MLRLESHSRCDVGSPARNLTLVIPIGLYWLCKLILTLITLALMNLPDVKASLSRDIKLVILTDIKLTYYFLVFEFPI